MENDQTICNLCDEKYKDSEELILCRGPCHKKVHAKCIGFTPAPLRFFRECKNLSYECDECGVNPNKQLSETLKRIFSFLCIINERLNRQESNSESIFTQCELINNNIQKTESELKTEINKVTGVMNTISESYAEVTKNAAIDSVVLVRPKTMQKCSETRADLNKKLILSEIAISSVNNMPKGGIEIKCKNKEELSKLHEKAIEKMGEDYNIVLPKLRKPKIRITNMSEKRTEVEIINCIIKHNKLVNAEIKVLHVYDIKNTESYGAIIEVDPKTFNILMQAGNVIIGMNICKITECLNVLRCYKCCGYNHKSSVCKNKKACLRCGGEHEVKECKSNTSECINCRVMSAKLKQELELNHPAWSRMCPVLQRKIEREKGLIKTLNYIYFGIWILLMITTSTNAWRPCAELSPALRFPCRCTLDEFGPKVQTVAMDCDRTVFTGGAPIFPKGAPITIYSQRYSGQQSIPIQSIASAWIPVRSIDFSHNLIRRLQDKIFVGLQDTLSILNLSDNLLGDSLNPIFSTAEFHILSNLKNLDLSGNQIKGLEEGILKGCDTLQVLNLSSNMIYNLAASNFEHLKSLQILDLSRNGIYSVPPSTFRDLNALIYLDVSLNSLRTIEDDAFEGLDSLQTLIIRDNNILLIPGSALGRLPRLSNLYLDYNRVAALSSDILGSIQPEDITHMSLSRNVIRELPAGSFQMFKKLRYLDLSGNSLASVNADTFAGLQTSLNELRISQNKITGLGSSPILLQGLRILDFSYNDLVDVPRDAFVGMENLQYLNLSSNNHLAPVPVTIFHSLVKLKVLDLSNIGMKTLPIELFANSQDIEIIKLAHNGIQEISDGSFANLRNITIIDLSYNKIMSIRSSSFINLMTIRKLNLKGNQLSAFKGEFFNTGTGLEEIAISNNHLSYLFPSSFRIHPRLKRIDASNNKIHFFPSELILSLQFLESVDLSMNSLRTIDELDFARLPRLRTLVMSKNELETISEMAFHNSTQLQIIDLSDNKLDRIGERTFEGLIRLEQLNLQGNKLSELPESIFERNKLQIMENINLSQNKFEIVPFKSLQRQYFFVVSVDLSHNKLKYIPAEDSTMMNIQKLDLSFNPLSKEALDIILKEPKTVRELNLAGTGITEITTLGTPFLQHLNLSHNDISDISKTAFQRATLLETLDLSSNLLTDAEALSNIWPMVDKLMYLDLSNNSFEAIAQGDFNGLEMLKTLNLVGLKNCSRLEKNAFKNLMNLNELRAYDLPRLGYLDVQGIVELLPALQILDIEIKDSTVGDDDIQASKHPRLRELGLRGQRLLSITPSTFASLKNKNLNIKLCNTSINSLPPTLLFPIPRSSNLDLDITGSEIKFLTPQLLNVFEDRRNSFHLRGLNSNPIHCDCNARALRRWLPGSKMPDLKCSSPSYLSGKLLIEVGDDELTCDQKKLTTTELPKTVNNVVHKSTSRVYLRPSTSEPEIIWSMPPTQPPIKIKTKAPLLKANTLNNDDTLIIGIVGGVVAFIAILIIIICIVRLRMSNTNYHSPPPMAMGMPGMPMGPGSVQLSYKGAPAPAFYTVPSYAQSYSTLPHKNLPPHHQSQQSLNQSRAGYSTMGRGPYMQQHTANGQPFII